MNLFLAKIPSLKISFLLKIFFFFTFFTTTFFIEYLPAQDVVAKINDKNITLKEFQSFVNVQIFTNSHKSLKDFLGKQKSSKNKLLQGYIDHKLLLKEAKKAGFSRKTPSVVKALNKIKENWIVSLYLSKAIDITTLSSGIDEKKVREEYNKLPNTQKSFDELGNQEKQQVAQLTFARISQDKKDELRKKLSKKYKVKKNGVKSKIVFSVKGKKYSQEDFKNYFEEQLQRVGISGALLRARQPERYAEISKNQLNEMILYKLVLLEIKKTKFDKKKELKNSLNLLIEQMVIQNFLQKKVVEKINISEEELNVSFSEILAKDPSINNMVPLEQEKIAKEVARRNKMPEAIEEYLIEVKERAVIRRNKEVIKKLK